MPTFTPGASPPPNDPFALTEPKSLSPLFGSAWKLWIGQPGVFLVTAAWVVIPFYVVVIGLAGGGFHDSLGAGDPIVNAASSVVLATLGTALVTAVHARAVVALASGRTLTTGDAFKLGTATFLPALAAGLLFALSIFGGIILLILPGIFMSVAGLFAAQHAALTREGAWTSLKASVALVRVNGWWRTLGYSFVLSLVTVALSGAGQIPVVVLSLVSNESPDLGMLAVPLLAITQAAAMSWTALVTTLLYFSWRAQAGDPFTAGPDDLPPSPGPHLT